MGLILGEKSAERLRSLCLDFQSKMVEKRSKADFPISAYTPWVGLEVHLDNEPSSLGSSEKLVLDCEALIWIQEKLNKSKKQDIVNAPQRSLVNINISRSIDDTKLYRTALGTLQTTSPFLSEVTNNIVQKIVPLKEKHRQGTGVSYQSIKGAIFLGRPVDTTPDLTLAINIAHEVGHQALMLYQTCDTLIDEKDLFKLSYSGVRKTFRPAINCLHAAAALCYMIKAASDLGDHITEHSKLSLLFSRLDEYRTDLLLTLKSILSTCSITEVGQLIIRDMLEVAEPRASFHAKAH